MKQLDGDHDQRLLGRFALSLLAEIMVRHSPLRRCPSPKPAEGDRGVIGILTRYNRKTVTVVADDGRRWNVSPTLLRGADGDRASEDQAPNIIPLRRK